MVRDYLHPAPSLSHRVNGQEVNGQAVFPESFSDTDRKLVCGSRVVPPRAEKGIGMDVRVPGVARPGRRRQEQGLSQCVEDAGVFTSLHTQGGGGSGGSGWAGNHEGMEPEPPDAPGEQQAPGHQAWHLLTVSEQRAPSGRVLDGQHQGAAQRGSWLWAPC